MHTDDIICDSFHTNLELEAMLDELDKLFQRLRDEEKAESIAFHRSPRSFCFRVLTSQISLRAPDDAYSGQPPPAPSTR